jgi:hypothetical protein
MEARWKIESPECEAGVGTSCYACVGEVSLSSAIELLFELDFPFFVCLSVCLSAFFPHPFFLTHWTIGYRKWESNMARLNQIRHASTSSWRIEEYYTF